MKTRKISTVVVDLVLVFYIPNKLMNMHFTIYYEIDWQFFKSISFGQAGKLRELSIYNIQNAQKCKKTSNVKK